MVSDCLLCRPLADSCQLCDECWGQFEQAPEYSRFLYWTCDNRTDPRGRRALADWMDRVRLEKLHGGP